MDCIAHGAWKGKSKLRSATQLFSHADFYLYYNPVSKSYKVSDIVNKALFEQIRESIRKYYITSLWSEIILKSYGAGEPSGQLFRLFVECLECLNTCAEQDEPYILVQFLWRFLSISGFRPDLNLCHECSKNITASHPLYYEKSLVLFSCGECARDKSSLLNPGIRIYLDKSLHLPVKKALAIKIEKNAIESLKKITYHIVESHLETRLNSLKSGEGII